MSISADTGERGAPVRTSPQLYASALALDAVPLAVLAAFVAEPSTRSFALVNLLVQGVLFVFGAGLPAHHTRVMAFADSTWSWGLVAVGVQALLFGDTSSTVVLIVSGMYVAMGGRLGRRAVSRLLTDFPREDLPRYRYRRLVWRREGYRSDTFPMLHEVAQQGLSNASLLAAPAMLAVADRNAVIGPMVAVGVLLWTVSWALESLADLQKARFLKRGAGVAATCDVGLWRHSRHPNYFFEWLVWHGLILVALPSLIRLADAFAVVPWLGFAVALPGISGGMYHVLVHATGAIPAEHFSARHRPGYGEYQERVNRFFPGPSRRPTPGPGELRRHPPSVGFLKNCGSRALENLINRVPPVVRDVSWIGASPARWRTRRFRSSATIRTSAAASRQRSSPSRGGRWSRRR
jgi:steroid 5-alpha reductase family enzyme